MNHDKRLKEIEGRVLYEISMVVDQKDCKNKNRILMIESSIERYHEKRFFITGRLNNLRSKDRRKNKKLSRENRALRIELAAKTKPWWKFFER